MYNDLVKMAPCTHKYIQIGLNEFGLPVILVGPLNLFPPFQKVATVLVKNFQQEGQGVILI